MRRAGGSPSADAAEPEIEEGTADSKIGDGERRSDKEGKEGDGGK